VRFSEFQDPKTKELQSVVVNTLNNLRGDADDAEQTLQISFDALAQIMKNTGYPQFNYSLFKQMYDSSETLKSVVDDFDQEKIILKTEKEMEKDEPMDYDDKGSTDVVKKMAKSALAKRT
jgi:LPS O-antigen subunit length determinant protein (WzzB/FepE family)|tara:strand:+ start:3309 stop:3668 length:360 start_codon:yes stop_codon:yes gene_type:complete